MEIKQIKISISDPFPTQEPEDIMGIKQKTLALIRYGIKQDEAFELALRMAGVGA